MMSQGRVFMCEPGDRIYYKYEHGSALPETSAGNSCPSYNPGMYQLWMQPEYPAKKIDWLYHHPSDHICTDQRQGWIEVLPFGKILINLRSLHRFLVFLLGNAYLRRESHTHVEGKYM